MMVRLCVVCVCLLLSIAVASGEEPGKAIYGIDDRIDYYEADGDMQELADSFVALISNFPTDGRGDMTPILSDWYWSLTEYIALVQPYPLCPTERYLEQPTAASCSGTLIGPDRILTAGHCVSSGDCCDKSFVFNYRYDEEDVLADVNFEKDVYQCRRVHSLLTDDLDYAIVQLDRPVVGRTPLNVSSSATEAQVGDSLTMIGHPSGLPQKIHPHFTVLNSDNYGSENAFIAFSDSFGGNSGSGIFSVEDNEIVGILVSGQTDYTVNPVTNDCIVATVYPCDSSDCASYAETSQYAFRPTVEAPECTTHADCANALTGSFCDLTCVGDVTGCTGWCDSEVPSGDLGCDHDTNECLNNNGGCPQLCVNLDGSFECQDFPVVLGCTDSDAANYNEEATADDGSCIGSADSGECLPSPNDEPRIPAAALARMSISVDTDTLCLKPHPAPIP